MEIRTDQTPSFNLKQNDVDIWQLSLADFDPHLNLLWEILSQSEQAYADRFRFASDKLSYILAFGGMRLLLSRYFACEPHELSYQWNRCQLAVSVAGHGLTLNCTISYNNAYAIVAIAKCGTLGADVKQVEAFAEQKKVVEGYFSQREQRVLDGLSAADGLHMFFTFLTCKSAICNAESSGDVQPLHQLDVSELGIRSAPLLNTSLRHDKHQVHTLALSGSHAAAVAFGHAVESARYFTATPMLLVADEVTVMMPTYSGL